MVGIYKITNPKGAVYVGQAIKLERRETDYARTDCKNQVKIYRSIKKYGWKNHKFKILLICEKSELNHYERKLGLRYNVLSKYNLNLNLPSDNDLPKLVSLETRLKMSKSCKGNQKRLGAVLSSKTKLKISNSLKGNIVSQETRDKISKSAKGRNVSQKTIDSIRTRMSKKVINVYTNEIHDSAKIVSELISMNYSTLKCQLNGLVTNRTNFKYLENHQF